MTDTLQQVNQYINGLTGVRGDDLRQLYKNITELVPDARLWFLDGRNSEGKVVSNPSIGFGDCTLSYSDGSSKPFYRVGISANTSGISVYFFGLPDKDQLSKKYGAHIGKATVSGYCIKFRSLNSINQEVLLQAIRDAFAA